MKIALAILILAILGAAVPRFLSSSACVDCCPVETPTGE